MAINRFSKIQTLPDWKPAIPAELLISGLKYKEELFAKNRNALSTTIGQLGTVDDMILNKKTKDQFNKDLDLAVKNINANYAFADLAKSSVITQAFGTFNNIASNPDYISRLKEANEIRNENQKKETFREKGEKYSDINDAVFSYHVNNYVEADPKDAARLSKMAIYTPYEDDKKWAAETIKSMEADKKIKISYSGPNNIAMITTTDESKTPVEVGQYLQTLMPDSVKKQLSINAEYEYIAGYQNPEVLKNQYTTYENSLLRKISNIDSELKRNKLDIAKINNFDDNKSELEQLHDNLDASLKSQKAELQNKLKEHKDKLANNSYTQSDIKNIFAQNYTTDWLNGMMGTLSTNVVIPKVELNPVASFWMKYQQDERSLDEAKKANLLKQMELGLIPVPEGAGFASMEPLPQQAITDPNQQLINDAQVRQNLEAQAFGWLTPGSAEWALMVKNLSPDQKKELDRRRKIDSETGRKDNEQEFIVTALKGLYSNLDNAKPGQKVNVPPFVQTMWKSRQLALSQLNNLDKQDKEFADKAKVIFKERGLDVETIGMKPIDILNALNALKMSVDPRKTTKIDQMDAEEFNDLAYALTVELGKKFDAMPLNRDLTASWDPRADQEAGSFIVGTRIRDQRDIDNQDKLRAKEFIRMHGGKENAYRVFNNLLTLTGKQSPDGKIKIGGSTLSMWSSNSFEDLYEDYEKGRAAVPQRQSFSPKGYGYKADTKVGEIWSKQHLDAAYAIYAGAVSEVGKKEDFSVIDMSPITSTITIALNTGMKDETKASVLAAAQAEVGNGSIVSVVGNKIKLKVDSKAPSFLSKAMNLAAEEMTLDMESGSTKQKFIANSSTFQPHMIEYRITPSEYGLSVTFFTASGVEKTIPSLMELLPPSERPALQGLLAYQQLGDVANVSLGIKTLLSSGSKNVDALIKAINLSK